MKNIYSNFLQINTFVIVAFLSLMPQVIQAQFVNGGFEENSAELTGWTQNGAVVSTGETILNWTVNPADNYMAHIKPVSNYMGSSAESVLNLSSGSLGFSGATNFGILYQDITLNAGQEITVWWNYVSEDYSPYDDGSFASFSGSGTQEVTMLVRTVSSGLVPATGSYGSSGWYEVSFTAPSEGTYRFGFGCFNYSDQDLNPHLFVDDGEGGTMAPGEPVLTTNPVTNITGSSAVSGGNITSVGIGASSITERGIVWNTSGAPTLASNTGSVSSGTGTGSFSAALSDLQQGTTYYVRAYATNNLGNTSYGGTVTFITADNTAPIIAGKTIDIFLDSTGYYTLTQDDIDAIFDTLINSTDIADLTLEVYPTVFNCVHVDPEGDDGSILQLFAEDIYGNKTKEWIPIHVLDTIFPEIVSIPNVEIEMEAGSCDTTVIIDYPEILASDNCDFELEQIAGLGADGIFPIGITNETWVATDKSGNTDTLTFMVKVTLANAAPTIDEIANIEVDEDSGPVVVEVSGISYGIDCREQGISVFAGIDSVLVDSVLVAYNSGDSTGTVSFYLAPEMFGDTLLSVVVKDGWGGTKTEFFRLTVNPVNDAPFLVTPLPDQVIHASWVLKIPISNSLGEIFDDIDDDELSIEIMEEGTTSLPAWAKMSGDTLICEPMIENTGYYNIIVTAMDTSGATAADTFEIFVDGYPTAVGEIGMESLEVQMYPNPTEGNVEIDINTGIHKVELSVMNITGKLVLNQQYSSAEKIVFNMSDKLPGMYFIKLNIDGFQVTKKLIVVNK